MSWGFPFGFPVVNIVIIVAVVVVIFWWSGSTGSSKSIIRFKKEVESEPISWCFLSICYNIGPTSRHPRSYAMG